MKATFSNNSEAKFEAKGRLERNAEDIADFLSSINPNWHKETLKSALFTNVDYQIALIEAAERKDAPAEARTWEATKSNIYKIADILADGIVKQFPRKF